MKRIVVYSVIIGCVASLFLGACSNENEIFPSKPEVADGNRIVLDIASATLPVSRAVEATGAEVKVGHVDVLIFGADEKRVHHERISPAMNGKTGTLALSAKREQFTAGEAYRVYLVANSVLPKEDFAAVADLAGLKSLTQQSRDIHVTGLGNNAPEAFLMDGIARQKGSAGDNVVLNRAGQTEDTLLESTLRRAAAKIVVVITQGEEVRFTEDPATAGAVYYLRNMPYTTSVLSGVDGEAELMSTLPAAPSDYFKWDLEAAPKKIVVTAYAYAHDWNDKSQLENEVRLIVNIPLAAKQNDGTQEFGEVMDSYYQIPVSKDKKLERNTCYYVTATVNAPGAQDPSEPETLQNVEYSVVEWEDKTVNVGGESERPIFLYVNEEEMAMYNMESDNTTLHFSSSMPVEAEVTGAYYIDKFGQETNVTGAIRDQISATPAEGLSGNIAVHSPVPTNNAIRYIKLKVSHKDNPTISREVTVAQYPLEYITNIQGWYSYRDDFGANGADGKPTTYELLNGEDVAGKTFQSSIKQRRVACSWDSGNWSYSNQSEGFFRSKVAKSKSDGTSDIYYYSWQQTGGLRGYRYSINESIGNLNNARMYHVRITATSSEYTLGKPRITDGKTDSGQDNAKLVSPSFMIASQLGAVSGANEALAASHCEQYVEVYKDATGMAIHLNDWRLPTEAELKIIAKFQQTEGSAVDVVLGGRNYFSASGIVDLGQGNRGNFLRCIRDVYDDETVNQ
ncbi:fimbrial tip adhesin FimD [Bacteroides muris (ex Fokt et al. 2023)]|uniref:DUF4906 domain-containing protein n=1 Tax=Bacteroides muris (ex Fokt et al. 2023) TaxID=2937417 RepID=A0A9X2NPD4_9BACE|nr:fimbrial protein [Bacteroides muris (ex Fokt et al. 2023)]MCR6503888.1 hypothetical protein [Bacteroides muris (ex Fokt et al. 2023)]